MCAASPSSGVGPGDSGAAATRTVDGREVVVGVTSVSLDRQQCRDGAVIMSRATAFREWIKGVTGAP